MHRVVAMQTQSLELCQEEPESFHQTEVAIETHVQRQLRRFALSSTACMKA